MASAAIVDGSELARCLRSDGLDALAASWSHGRNDKSIDQLSSVPVKKVR